MACKSFDSIRFLKRRTAVKLNCWHFLGLGLLRYEIKLLLLRLEYFKRLRGLKL